MIEGATFLVDEVDVPVLRKAVSELASIGYYEKDICERLGLSDLTELMWRAVPIYREERLTVHDALDLAINLFFLQGNISTDELNQLFHNDEKDVLIRAGLLLIHKKRCFARASLYPVGDHLIFSDHAWPKLPHPGYARIPYDQVMFIGADSRWLARTTTHRQVGSTLDLCTGSGVHALLASVHSKRVVAVDINPRAARCAHFNALVSGATNIEVAVGDLFQPVFGEYFDLITANPPFVPSPMDTIEYRDGGNSGEDVLGRIVNGLPQHLLPGGIAQIVTEMGEGDERILSDRLRVWLDDAPMDILILRLGVHPAASYAIAHADGDDDYEAFLSSVEAWSNNLRTQGYTNIISVLIAFKWSDPTLGEPWTRIEEAKPPHRDASAELEAIFFAERMARQPNLRQTLEHSKIRRGGAIGLMEARVLGSELHANAQVELLGKALSIIKWINPVELQVLELIEKPIELSSLLILTSEHNIKEEVVMETVSSLLRNGLLILA